MDKCVIIKIMKTRIEKIDQNKIDMELIAQAGEILKNGGLVAFPTETVYGLGANALDQEGARKTYEAKGRPSDNPLIVHICDYESLFEIAGDIPECTKVLAERFWPGPLTLIFQKSEKVPYGVTGGLETVAVRMPDHKIALALIAAAGGFVSAPSANTSGRPSPTAAEHVAEDLDGRIDMILDGGNVDIGVESTILDMTVTPPMILRPGAVTKEMLEEVLGEVEVDSTILSAKSEEAPKAPGMKYRHYAPKAQMTLVEGSVHDTIRAIRQLAYEADRQGKRVGIIASTETADQYTKGIVKTIGNRENKLSVARNLYAVLRRFDEEQVDVIYSEAFPEDGIGQAVMNRLGKAAGHRVVPAEEIVKLQPLRRIIFVSQDDNCRAAGAERLLRSKELLQEYDIGSRGLVVLFPEPINPKAEEVFKEHGICLEGHQAEALTEADLTEETLVLTMEETQKWKIVSDFQFVKNVYTFYEYLDLKGEIFSRYGQPLEAYEQMYQEMNNLTNKLADKLNEEAKGRWQKYM